MTERNIFKRFYPVILLVIVVLVSVTLLRFVDTFTRPKIEAQEEAQTQAQLKSLFPDMTDYTLKDDVYIINTNGKRIGYAFLATGMGYHGAITILVGLENETTLKGISIISQSETAGLGDRIRQFFFTDRFAGKNIADIKLKQDGGEIDAITGSTISSRAVIDAVREEALKKVKALPK